MQDARPGHETSKRCGKRQMTLTLPLSLSKCSVPASPIRQESHLSYCVFITCWSGRVAALLAARLAHPCLLYVRSGQAMYVPVCADRHVTAKYSAGTCTRACPHCRISLSSPGLHGAKRAPQAGKQAVEPTAIQQPAIQGEPELERC